MGTWMIWLISASTAFAKKLLDFTQLPFVAVGTFVTFGSGLYGFNEWVRGSFQGNMVKTDDGRYIRNWESLAQAINQGVAMGFVAGIPWFAVALWAAYAS
jgi:hypothetical protein